MNRAYILTGLLFFIAETPARAFVTDSAIQGMIYAEDKTFHAFMKLQIVQEIALLKQSYDASIRYIDEFNRLNSGRGFFQNVAAQLKTSITQENNRILQELDQTFVHTNNTNTPVDKFFQRLDTSVSDNIKYVGDELANVIENRKTGEDIAANADGLSPKDAANLTAKSGGIQIQMLSLLHEDNVRMIQLQSMQLANDARNRQSEAQSIDALRQSVKARAPGYQEPQSDSQGGGQ